MILAQRLVRRICSDCKQAYEPLDGELADLGLTRADLEGRVVYKAVGCETCLKTGYKGRTGIYCSWK